LFAREEGHGLLEDDASDARVLRVPLLEPRERRSRLLGLALGLEAKGELELGILRERVVGERLDELRVTRGGARVVLRLEGEPAQEPERVRREARLGELGEHLREPLGRPGSVLAGVGDLTQLEEDLLPVRGLRIRREGLLEGLAGRIEPPVELEDVRELEPRVAQLLGDRRVGGLRPRRRRRDERAQLLLRPRVVLELVGRIAHEVGPRGKERVLREPPSRRRGPGPWDRSHRTPSSLSSNSFE
jgi:hypothetical protein